MVVAEQTKLDLKKLRISNSFSHDEVAYILTLLQARERGSSLPEMGKSHERVHTKFCVMAERLKAR